jgi:beta-phosphoglucomutase-like phosphatase (HAD superfamily)
MTEFDLSNFDAIALDFDGTLANSNDAHTESRIAAYEELAAELGDERYASIPFEAHVSAHLDSGGTHSHGINAWLMAKYGIIDDPTATEHPAVARAVARIKVHYHEKIKNGLDEQPGAVQFVRSVSVHMPGKLAIASTALRVEVMPYLMRHKLTHYFSDRRLILGDDQRVARLKPAPDAYEVAARELGVTDPSRMLAVEDSQGGVEAAKLMGSTVVAIASTRTEEALRRVERDLAPDEVVPDIPALRALLGLRVLGTRDDKR